MQCWTVRRRCFAASHHGCVSGLGAGVGWVGASSAIAALAGVRGYDATGRHCGSVQSSSTFSK